MKEEYFKDFDGWNKKKKEFHNKDGSPFSHEKEIWWCGMGVNIGSEQDGKGEDYARPVLVYKKVYRNLFLGIPITKVLKLDDKHLPFYFDYDLHTFLIFQIRLFDSKRLIFNMGIISDYLYIKTKKA